MSPVKNDSVIDIDSGSFIDNDKGYQKRKRIQI